MWLELRVVWALLCVLSLVTMGCTAYLPAVPTWYQAVPQPGRRYGRNNKENNNYNNHNNHNNHYNNNNSGGGSVALSGSSSRPVQPIKPLLDLSAGKNTGGAALPMPLRPIFDQAAPRNVSSLTGSAAYLHCLVHNLGNKSVSWIRRRDLHILTVGRYTYTTDQRFEVLHSPHSQDWILKISYAQVRDSGFYECQVSTKPIRSYQVYLNVFAPQAVIEGAPDLHVDKGSTIHLTCSVAHGPDPPAYIFWYHNDQVVNYESSRGGISVVTERGNTTKAYLLIQDAGPLDTGNYSCVPSNTAPTSLTVHVLHGETPAAMQTNGAPSTSLLNMDNTLPLLLPLFVTSLLTKALGEGVTYGALVGRSDGR